MNNTEEKLWDYIDGSCTAEERENINSLLLRDEAFKLRYEELLLLNKEFSAIALDEPSMAFTYHVIEAIRTEKAQQPLKAAVNKRVIISIALFFITTIAILLVYTTANIDWSAISISAVDIKLPQIKNYINQPMIQGFLFVDVVLGLFLFDNYLRKKTFSKHFKQL